MSEMLTKALEVLKTCAENIKIGIFKTMSDKDYFAHSAINCSGLNNPPAKSWWV
jgi:hypothetical protein